MEIEIPKIINYDLCLSYLNRSDKELMHQVRDKTIFKLLEIGGEKVLIQIELGNDKLNITCLNHPLTTRLSEQIKKYVSDWFDLAAPLERFYEEVGEEEIFNPLIRKFHGLRLIRIPDLFETICWSIMGQQINLNFAYQMKHGFIKSFGEYEVYRGTKYYLFPKAKKIAEVDDDFKALKFSKQKTSYIKGVAELISDGRLSKNALKGLEPELMKSELMKIKGIGNWSANYVMMRCFGLREAFPIEDVGLHNALRQSLNLDHKPSLDEVREISKNWDTWKAYRTYYLWHSLMGN